MQAVQAQHGHLRSFHSRRTYLLSVKGYVCMDWDQMMAPDRPVGIDAINHFPQPIALRHAKASLLQLLRSSNLRKLGKEIASWRGFSYKWIPFFKQGMERFCFICIVFLSLDLFWNVRVEGIESLFIKGLAFLFVVPGDGWLVALWFSEKDGLTRPTFSGLDRVGMNQVIYWQLHGSMVFIYKSHQNEGSDCDLQYVCKCRGSCGSTWIILSRILN